MRVDPNRCSLQRALLLTSAVLSAIASPLLATTADEVLASLKQQFTFTEVNSWTGGIKTPGTMLIVQQEGLVAETGSIRTTIHDGRLTNARGSIVGARSTGYDLKPGDKVYIYAFFPWDGGSAFAVKYVAVQAHDTVTRGTTTAKHGAGMIVFTFSNALAGVDTSSALGAFSAWFKTEQQASESRSVKIGQTPEEVEAALGPPEKRIDLGAKKIFVYKDLKVIFVDGHVSDVQ